MMRDQMMYDERPDDVWWETRWYMMRDQVRY